MAPSRPGLPRCHPPRRCDDGNVTTVARPRRPRHRPPWSTTPPLVRRRSGRFVAGVAGGVADHLGVPVLWVRAGFVVLAGVDGAGVLAYGLLWIFVRQENGDRPRPRRTERQQAFGLAALGIGAGLAAAAGRHRRRLDRRPARRGGDRGRRRVAGGRPDPAPPLDGGRPFGVTDLAGCGRTALLRVMAGAVFVAGGIAVFLLGNLQLAQVQFALLAVLATLVGVAVLTVPWWVRLMRDLGEERRERIVETERAEIAAHLHDSVLQTLALIQRQSDQPREVLRLARGQERELRHWLYGPAGYGRSSRVRRAHP